MKKMRKLIENNYQIIQEFINSMRVGIFIADNKGDVLMLNNESERTGGMTRSELIGKNVTELIEIGYMEESTILTALKTNRPENIIQALGTGENLYISGVPLITDGEIDIVICTERDITETSNLKELLREKAEITEKYEKEVEYLRSKNPDNAAPIIAESSAMRNAVEIARRVAKLDTTVLLYGESGTGKELVANLIHGNSKRAGEVFIKINCAAIPDNLLESELFGYEGGAFTGADKKGKAGMFELAGKGTIFLDEISEMSIHMQSKMLRVLQEKEVMRIGGSKEVRVNARIITATNVNLKDAIAKGAFREDLYYRLNVVPIELPPLRMRGEDIRELTLHFVDHFNKEYNLDKKLSSDALECLMSYPWPGNVRELRNIIERVMISFDGENITRFQISNQLYSVIGVDYSDGISMKGETLEKRLEAFEKNIFSELIGQLGSGSKVADALGINKSTVSRKLKKYRIETPSLR